MNGCYKNQTSKTCWAGVCPKVFMIIVKYYQALIQSNGHAKTGKTDPRANTSGPVSWGSFIVR